MSVRTDNKNTLIIKSEYQIKYSKKINSTFHFLQKFSVLYKLYNYHYSTVLLMVYILRKMQKVIVKEHENIEKDK